MRLNPANLDKFATIVKAGRPRKKRGLPSLVVATADTSFDDEIPLGTQLYKTARERQIEAIKNEDRHWKRYQASRRSRVTRLTSEVPGARKFITALSKVAPTARATAYRDVDVDIAGLARRLGLAKIENPYDRFTVFEEAVAMVDRVAKRTGRYTEPANSSFFTQTDPTALDELKAELRLR